MRSITAALLASTLLSAGPVLPAFAQTPPPPPPAATTTPAPAPTPPAPAPATPPAATSATTASGDETTPKDDQAASERRRSMAADRNAMFEAHLAALHAGLTLSPEQDKLWPPVEQSIRGFVKMRADLRDRRADMRQDREDSDEDPVAVLKTYAADQLERAQALKALADAIEPLNSSLTDEQRHRLPMLLEDMTPRRGPIARMIEQLHHEGDRSAMRDDADQMDRPMHGRPDEAGRGDRMERGHGPMQQGRDDARADDQGRDDTGWHDRRADRYDERDGDVWQGHGSYGHHHGWAGDQRHWDDEGEGSGADHRGWDGDRRGAMHEQRGAMQDDDQAYD